MSDEPQSAKDGSGTAKDSAGSPAPSDEIVDPNDLSEEEQMEKFAEQLKEDDWGHQPC
jgi:hypothetical protein